MIKYSQKFTTLILTACFLFLQLSLSSSGISEILNEFDFEIVENQWLVERSGWTIGLPAADTGKCYTGVQCAMIEIGQGSNDSSSMRLTSPQIHIPITKSDETIYLSFWHRFVLDGPDDNEDRGYVEISQDGNHWDLAFGPFIGAKQDWRKVYVDISAYRGKAIHLSFSAISFLEESDSWWHIDRVVVEIIKADNLGSLNIIQKRITF